MPEAVAPTPLRSLGPKDVALTLHHIAGNSFSYRLTVYGDGRYTFSPSFAPSEEGHAPEALARLREKAKAADLSGAMAAHAMKEGPAPFVHDGPETTLELPAEGVRLVVSARSRAAPAVVADFLREVRDAFGVTRALDARR